MQVHPTIRTVGEARALIAAECAAVRALAVPVALALTSADADTLQLCGDAVAVTAAQLVLHAYTALVGLLYCEGWA